MMAALLMFSTDMITFHMRCAESGPHVPWIVVEKAWSNSQDAQYIGNGLMIQSLSVFLKRLGEMR
jgi:hypothetical protein